MSDMSSLSHEYASTTDFSHHINQAVLLLKKQHLGDRNRINSDDLAKACALVAGVVRRLLERLHAQIEGPERMQSAEAIPEDILIRLEERERGNLHYFVEDLARLNESLSDGSALSASQIALLDSICEVADASASATFRKLWRR